MALAAGILILVIASFLLFYSSGKSTWSFDQTIQYMLGSVAVLGLLGGSLVIYLNRTGGSVESDVGYAGIQLGDSMEDVRFKKGIGRESTGAESRATWVYDGDYTLVVFFDNEAKVFLAVVERSGQLKNLPRLGKINWNMKVEDLTAALGKPSQVVVLDQGLSRRYEYEKLKLFVSFTQGVIDAVGIRDFSVPLQAVPKLPPE